MEKNKRSDSLQWKNMYKLAKQYYEECGDLLIPGNYITDGKRLGAWVGTQRYDYLKRKNLYFTEERIELLQAIGMIWDVRESQWQKMFVHLNEYMSKYETTHVPQSYNTSCGLHLGTWVNTQRLNKKNGKMSNQHYSQLEALNMIWDAEILRRGKWDLFYEELCAYKKEHGQILVPPRYTTTNGYQLGKWLVRQRAAKQRKKILLHREQKLTKLGMAWSVLDKQWEAKYEIAAAYYKKNGDLNLYLRRDGTAPKNLSTWLVNQRKAYHEKKLDSDKTSSLENISMMWDICNDNWFDMYGNAKRFYVEHGHLRVSKNPILSLNRKLGDWIHTQRAIYKKNDGRLQDNRVQLLEDIGMIWDASIDPKILWYMHYEEAKQFYVENGHLNPSKGSLRTWIHTQRYARRGGRGSISNERIQLLDAINMDWNPNIKNDERWEKMYSLAKEYYEIHEKLNIPSTYITQDGMQLGAWLSRQRTGYKNYLVGLKGSNRTTITAEKIEKLNSIDMIWDASRLNLTSFPEKVIYFYLRTVYPDVCKLSRWEEYGFELDVYLPTIKTGIEYDGIWHKQEEQIKRDLQKSLLCVEANIKLIRFREPQLPDLHNNEIVIYLSDYDVKTFEKALHKLFELLGHSSIDICITRDKKEILSLYKDYVSRKWDAMYSEVKQYTKEHGQLPISPDILSNKGTSFGNWISTQRSDYNNDLLTKKQIEKLQKLGISLRPFEQRWLIYLNYAKEYWQQHGDLLIPANYVTCDGVRLGSWIAAQRGLKRQNNLSLKRVQILESLNIVWEPLKQKQVATLSEIRKFKSKHKHLQIPASHITENGVRLGDWIVKIRKMYRDGLLSESEIKQYRKMGIEWDVLPECWNEIYKIACNYYNEHGNLWVSPSYVTPKGILLGGWISKQRSKYGGKSKNAPLSSEQIKKLEDIGMIWAPYEVRWIKKYNLAKEYYLAYGHLNIHHEYITPCGVKLGMWISS